MYPTKSTCFIPLRSDGSMSRGGTPTDMATDGSMSEKSLFPEAKVNLSANEMGLDSVRFTLGGKSVELGTSTGSE